MYGHQPKDWGFIPAVHEGTERRDVWLDEPTAASVALFHDMMALRRPPGLVGEPLAPRPSELGWAGAEWEVVPGRPVRVPWRCPAWHTIREMALLREDWLNAWKDVRHQTGPTGLESTREHLAAYLALSWVSLATGRLLRGDEHPGPSPLREELPRNAFATEDVRERLTAGWRDFFEQDLRAICDEILAYEQQKPTTARRFQVVTSWLAYVTCMLAPESGLPRWIVEEFDRCNKELDWLLSNPWERADRAGGDPSSVARYNPNFARHADLILALRLENARFFYEQGGTDDEANRVVRALFSPDDGTVAEVVRKALQDVGKLLHGAEGKLTEIGLGVDGKQVIGPNVQRFAGRVGDQVESTTREDGSTRKDNVDRLELLLHSGGANELEVIELETSLRSMNRTLKADERIDFWTRTHWNVKYRECMRSLELCRVYEHAVRSPFHGAFALFEPSGADLSRLLSEVDRDRELGLRGSRDAGALGGGPAR